MVLMNFYFSLIVCVFLPFNLFAESLPHYVEKAIQSSGLKQQYVNQLREISFRKKNIGQLENPTIGFEYGRVKNTGITGSLVGATIEQNLPINGRLGLRERGEDEAALQTSFENQWSLNEYKAQLIQTFLALWIQREEISHAKHRIEDLAVLRSYLTSRKFSSPQQKTNAYLIKKKIEEMEYILFENAHLKKKLEETLSALTETTIDNFDLRLKSPKVLKEVFSRITVTSSSIKNFRDSVLKKNNYSLEEYKRKWIPDLRVGYSYQKENVPGGNLGHAIGINFDIPLFDTGKNKSDELRAKRRVLEASWSLKDLQRQSSLSALKEKFSYYLKLSGGSLKEKERIHQKELKKIKDYFLKGLINAQAYLDTEEISHDLHYRQVNAIREIVNVFVESSLETGKDFDLKEVLL